MKLGMALLDGAKAPRRALVAQLPSDLSRLVDLNAVEQVRLARLGEGRPDRVADALLPPSLRRLLESGPRAILRARQALAYADKWHLRGDLPEHLAPSRQAAQPLPCLPRPSALLRADGTRLDRSTVRGPGATLQAPPHPTLAMLSQWNAAPAGFCLALEDAGSVVLGMWMCLDVPSEGHLELYVGTQHRRVPMDTWTHLTLPPLKPASVMLLPHPHLKGLTRLLPDCAVRVVAPFDTLHLRLGEDTHHATIQ